MSIGVQRAHKIRLNPTPEQEQYFRQACGTARFVYNWGLAEWRRQYQAGHQPSGHRLKEQFNAIKREQFPWVHEVTKCAVDTGFANLHQAFQHFFRRVELKKQGKHKGPLGYPRFKSRKRSKQSFRMDGARVQVDGHGLKLEHLDAWINMAEELRLALSLADAGFGEIRRQLAYKVEWYGGVLVAIDMFFPSSKLCSQCGTIKDDLTLHDRTFSCECGFEIDRDWNAARNIEREALCIVASVASATLQTHVDGMQDLMERQSRVKRESEHI